MTKSPAISFSDRFDQQFGSLNYCAEGILDVFGTARHVKMSGKDIEIKTSSYKQNWKITAAKIALWVGTGFLLPLLALAWKAGTRRYKSSTIRSLRLHQDNKLDLPSIVNEFNSGKKRLTDFGSGSVIERLKQLLPYKEHIHRINLGFSTHQLSIKDQEIKFLVKHFPHLTELIVHSKSMTKDSFVEIAKLDKLSRLDFFECEGMNDKDLIPLQSLTKLKHLNLSHCDLITDKGLAHIAKISSLESLNLASNFNEYFPIHKSITGTGIGHLSTLPNLKKLNVRNCIELGEKVISELLNFPRLECLYMDGQLCFSGDSLSIISNIKTLKKLRINVHENLNGFCQSLLTKTEWNGNLQPCHQIEELHLRFPSYKQESNSHDTTAGFSSLLQVPGIKTLKISNATAVKSNKIKLNKPNPSLTHLQLTGCTSMTGDYTAFLDKFPNLESVGISEHPTITDTEIMSLAKLKGIQSIYLDMLPMITETAIFHLIESGVEQIHLTGHPHINTKKIKEWPKKYQSKLGFKFHL